MKSFSETMQGAWKLTHYLFSFNDGQLGNFISLSLRSKISKGYSFSAGEQLLQSN